MTCKIRAMARQDGRLVSWLLTRCFLFARDECPAVFRALFSDLDSFCSNTLRFDTRIRVPTLLPG